MANENRIEELEAPARDLSAEETNAVSGGAMTYGDAFLTPDSDLALGGGGGGAGKAYGAGGGAGKIDPTTGEAFGAGGGAGK